MFTDIPGIDTWIWLALGMVLIAAEALVPGAVLIWFGVAAIIGGLVFITWDLTLAGQFLFVAVLALLLLAIGRRPLKQWTERRQAAAETLNRRGEALVGRQITLAEALTDGIGRVRIGDGIWPVTGPDLPAGTRVRVVGVEGNTLRVEPMKDGERRKSAG